MFGSSPEPGPIIQSSYRIQSLDPIARSNYQIQLPNYPITQSPNVMSILKVARMGHPVLRIRAHAVERAQIKAPGFQRLIDDLMDTMVEYHGIGLAAPQVHESVRVFV